MSQTQVKIQPENHLMVGLLGQRDELLRLIEASFDAKPFVRGNEITVEGPGAEDGSAEGAGRQGQGHT